MTKFHPNRLPALMLLFLPFFMKSEINLLPVSPLNKYSTEWNDPKYAVCNTAAKITWLTQSEKDVIYILNLIRTNPSLFLETVIKKYPEMTDDEELLNSSYYKSLVETFKTLEPVNILKPDQLCFNSARCHAEYAGQIGYVGHDRKPACEKIQHYSGECCDYGSNDALEILMNLLIDEDVPSLGHREICLDNYNKLGVSIQPHKVYSYNAVLDFSY